MKRIQEGMLKSLGWLLVGLGVLDGCSSSGDGPRTASGKRLKLEVITHDWQTTYAYRPVADEEVAPKANGPTATH